MITTNQKVCWARDYILTREKNARYSILSRLYLFLCTKAFVEYTEFNIWTFPLKFRHSIISAIFTHRRALTVGHNGSWPMWELCIKAGWMCTLQYRLIATEQDFQELLSSDRNQLEGEILLAVVIDKKHLCMIKEKTLNGEWKRIPLFVSWEQIEILVEKRFSNITSDHQFFDLEQSDRLVPCATAWTKAIRIICDLQNDSPITLTDSMILKAEITVLSQIRRKGELEKFYQYFVKNIDNPFKYLDDWLNKKCT